MKKQQIESSEEYEEKSSFSFSFTELLKYFGPGLLISIAYLDPGNLSGDMDAGLVGKYGLLWVLFLSTSLGYFFQVKAMKLGMFAGQDLAQLCRTYFRKQESYLLWIMAEIAIMGSDIQEVLGTAISLNILFKLELWQGVLLTIFSTFLILIVRFSGPRKLEIIFAIFIGTMAVSFFINLNLISPDPVEIVQGFIPQIPTGSIGPMVGLIGAVLMPHNLYLHSAIISEKDMSNQGTLALKKSLFYHKIETALSLLISFFINGAVLCTFAMYSEKIQSLRLSNAADVLATSFGSVAKYIWGIGLFASGQSSTLTGTLAGQFVMSGFLKLKMGDFQRALLTRSIAIIPSLIIVFINTNEDFNGALNVLQAIQLPFAILPLLKFSNCIEIMGKEKISKTELYFLSSLSAGIVIANFYNLMPSEISLSQPKTLVGLFLFTIYLMFLVFIFKAKILVDKIKSQDLELLGGHIPISSNDNCSDDSSPDIEKKQIQANESPIMEKERLGNIQGINEDFDNLKDKNL